MLAVKQHYDSIAMLPTVLYDSEICTHPSSQIPEVLAETWC